MVEEMSVVGSEQEEEEEGADVHEMRRMEMSPAQLRRKMITNSVPLHRARLERKKSRMEWGGSRGQE